MKVLTIRTDNPQAEIGLYDADNKLAYETWQAHRQLAETLHHKIQEILEGQKVSLQDLTGIIVYQGPGSFTGLRIGLSVANALADALSVAIVGSQTDAWIQSGLDRLRAGNNDQVVVPEYGAPVHITEQKK